MKRRHAPYFAVILVLLLVNVARWTLQAESGDRPVGERAFMPEDFRLHVDVPDADSSAARDLFSGVHASGTSLEHAASVRHIRVQAAVKTPSLPLPVSAASSPQATAPNLRLLGVVFHGGKRQAYVAQDKENVIASAGETIFGQYEVSNISIDAVELKDIRSNITTRIPVSGK